MTSVVDLNLRRAARRRAQIEVPRTFAMPKGAELWLYEDGSWWALDSVGRNADSISRVGIFPTWIEAMRAGFAVQEAAQGGAS